jgi:hypothetical protein
MKRQGWTWCCIVGLTICNVWAQEAAQRPNPAPNIQIVRVRIEESCGWCTGNYDDSVTTTEPGSIVRLNRASSDRQAYPDIETKYTIAKRDWVELQQLIDAGVLAAFADKHGCPGCADEPTVSVEVEFSDGTRKSGGYNVGGTAPPITALLQEIAAIQAKARSQNYGLQKSQPAHSPYSEVFLKEAGHCYRCY